MLKDNVKHLNSSMRALGNNKVENRSFAARSLGNAAEIAAYSSMTLVGLQALCTGLYRLFKRN